MGAGTDNHEVRRPSVQREQRRPDVKGGFRRHRVQVPLRRDVTGVEGGNHWVRIEDGQKSYKSWYEHRQGKIGIYKLN